MKKLIAVLLVSVLTVLCVVSLASCGISIPAGDQVTEEEWKAAFANMSAIKNYTLNVARSINVDVKGSVTTDKTQEIVFKAETGRTLIELMDFINEKAYRETTNKTVAKGVADGEQYDTFEELLNKDYWEFYKADLYDQYWKLSYFKEASKNLERNYNQENFWNATVSSDFADLSVDNDVFYEYYYDSDLKDAKESRIVDLYDKFTFSGGKYTAKLYQRVSLVSSVYEMLECTVTVSISKEHNCIIGFGVKVEGKGDVNEDMSFSSLTIVYDLEYSYKGEYAFALTDIDNTKPETKLNGEMQKVLDKAKADKE